MTQQRIPLIIQLSAAQTSAGPFDLDYRFAPQQIRSIAGSAGATSMIVLVSPVPRDINARYSIIGDTSIGAHTGFFTTVSSYTGSFNDIIQGPWCQIKVERASASGTCTLYVLG